MGRLGWLLVIGAVAGAGLMAQSGASESELVEVSRYPVLMFGFGVGVLIGRRKLADAPSAGQAVSGALIIGALAAAIAAYGRWYFFAKIF